MRLMIAGLVVMLATSVAEARDCNGQGSAQVLSVQDWASSSGTSQVDVTYRLHDDKAVTLLQGHVYFLASPEEVLADAAIALKNSAGVRASGVQPVTLSKDAARRLAKVPHDSVSVLVCTNYIEYLDGSGSIIA